MPAGYGITPLTFKPSRTSAFASRGMTKLSNSGASLLHLDQYTIYRINGVARRLKRLYTSKGDYRIKQ